MSRRRPVRGDAPPAAYVACREAAAQQKLTPSARAALVEQIGRTPTDVLERKLRDTKALAAKCVGDQRRYIDSIVAVLQDAWSERTAAR